MVDVALVGVNACLELLLVLIQALSGCCRCLLLLLLLMLVVRMPCTRTMSDWREVVVEVMSSITMVVVVVVVVVVLSVD